MNKVKSKDGTLIDYGISESEPILIYVTGAIGQTRALNPKET